MSELELERHIRDCECLWRAAYARFQRDGLRADREEARLWLQRQNEAILARSPAAQARRHAAFERRLDDGAGYFIDMADRDRAALSATKDHRGLN